MGKQELKQILVDWSSTFFRISMVDLNHYTRSVGLSMVQMNAMMHLFYNNSSEVSFFSEMLQISRAGASQMIERLVKQEIVQRVEKPGDRRVRLVELTEHGRQIVLASIAAREAWVDRLVQDFSPDEYKTIAAALMKLNERAVHLEMSVEG